MRVAVEERLRVLDERVVWLCLGTGVNPEPSGADNIHRVVTDKTENDI